YGPDGDRGSVQDFVDAPTAFEVEQKEYQRLAGTDVQGAFEKAGANKWGNAQDQQRAAIFDFVTGQGDRHEHNWLVQDGHPVLIDNGLNFPNRFLAHSKFVEHVASK